MAVMKQRMIDFGSDQNDHGYHKELMTGVHVERKEGAVKVTVTQKLYLFIIFEHLQALTKEGEGQSQPATTAEDMNLAFDCCCSDLRQSWRQTGKKEDLNSNQYFDLLHRHIFNILLRLIIFISIDAGL